MLIFAKIKSFFSKLFHKQKIAKENAHVFYNVIFRDPFGDPYLTHQIDRIVVNKNGIFVIEDKEWAGEIYGFADDDFWRQVKRNGKKRFERTHRNPIEQNEVHAAVVEEIFLNQYNVVPYVVMKNNNAGNINDWRVINEDELQSCLRDTSSDPLTDDDINWICNKIKEKDCSAFVSEEEHVKNIKRKYKDR